MKLQLSKGQMSKGQMSKGVSRFAALGLLFFVVWFFYGLVLAPIFGAYGEVDDNIESTKSQLARLESISQSYPALKAQLDELARRTAKSGVYLAGNTDALAAAGLQEDVSVQIGRAGGTLRSVQILPATSDGDFKKVSVRVQLTATLVQFTKLLYSLEAARPFVFVDNLDIKNRRTRSREADQNPELIIRFDLYGYLRPRIS